ncbi:zinc finger, C3HC4 type [Dictyocaulus viviparus]|uniref:Zinc finger, C3HC4 type n=1 Tax=Dictyocaulus viviparus TaxID=29172 RepID=A0A0D8Y908_DICVI|nr:zinc finger, C3HC4 type [Dictyocaulus viviparus]
MPPVLGGLIYIRRRINHLLPVKVTIQDDDHAVAVEQLLLKMKKSGPSDLQMESYTNLLIGKALKEIRIWFSWNPEDVILLQSIDRWSLRVKNTHKSIFMMVLTNKLYDGGSNTMTAFNSSKQLIKGNGDDDVLLIRGLIFCKNDMIKMREAFPPGAGITSPSKAGRKTPTIIRLTTAAVVDEAEAEAEADAVDMSTIVIPHVTKSDDVKSERQRHNSDAQSTASADSGNGSLNNVRQMKKIRLYKQNKKINKSIFYRIQYVIAIVHQHGRCLANKVKNSSEKKASPSTVWMNENQPLIVKNVDEQLETDIMDVNGCPIWLPNQHISSHLTTSKGSVCSSTIALCRICHTECDNSRDPFVSPCRCSGSLLYVHRSCLVFDLFRQQTYEERKKKTTTVIHDNTKHWLELSTRKMVPSPRCELCGYNYRRRNFVNLSSLHFPHLSTRDRLLNIMFLIVFIIMDSLNEESGHVYTKSRTARALFW